MLAYLKIRQNIDRGGNPNLMEELEYEGFKDGIRRYWSQRYYERAKRIPPPSPNNSILEKEEFEGEQQWSARTWFVTLSPPEGTISETSYDLLRMTSKRQGWCTPKWYPCISMAGHAHVHGILYLKKHAPGKYLSEIKRWLKHQPIGKACKMATIDAKPLHTSQDLERTIKYIEDPEQNEKIIF